MNFVDNGFEHLVDDFVFNQQSVGINARISDGARIDLGGFGISSFGTDVTSFESGTIIVGLSSSLGASIVTKSNELSRKFGVGLESIVRFALKNMFVCIYG